MTLNLRPVVIPGFLVILLLLFVGCTDKTGPAPVPDAESTTAVTPAVSHPAAPDEMVSFVKEAVAYARANGKEKALAEFSNRNGSFFRGELYIYAYDTNGTTIAHPVNPEKIGVNRIHEKDAQGNLFIQELRSAAMNGTGFVTYYYINPTHQNAVEKKLGYAMTVDPSWWLGSGIYQGPADAPVPTATGTFPITRNTTTPSGS
jgi:cytochrome c